MRLRRRRRNSFLIQDESDGMGLFDHSASTEAASRSTATARVAQYTILALHPRRSGDRGRCPAGVAKGAGPDTPGGVAASAKDPSEVEEAEAWAPDFQEAPRERMGLSQSPALDPDERGTPRPRTGEEAPRLTAAPITDSPDARTTAPIPKEARLPLVRRVALPRRPAWLVVTATLVALAGIVISFGRHLTGPGSPAAGVGQRPLPLQSIARLRPITAVRHGRDLAPRPSAHRSTPLAASGGVDARSRVARRQRTTPRRRDVPVSRAAIAPTSVRSSARHTPAPTAHPRAPRPYPPAPRAREFSIEGPSTSTSQSRHTGGEFSLER